MNIVAVGDISLSPSVEASVIKCPACRPGYKVFLQEASGEATSGMTSIDPDEVRDGEFIVRHNAIGANCRFQYMVVSP